MRRLFDDDERVEMVAVVGVRVGDVAVVRRVVDGGVQRAVEAQHAARSRRTRTCCGCRAGSRPGLRSWFRPWVDDSSSAAVRRASTAYQHHRRRARAAEDGRVGPGAEDRARDGDDQRAQERRPEAVDDRSRGRTSPRSTRSITSMKALMISRKKPSVRHVSGHEMNETIGLMKALTTPKISAPKTSAGAVSMSKPRDERLRQPERGDVDHEAHDQAEDAEVLRLRLAKAERRRRCRRGLRSCVEYHARRRFSRHQEPANSAAQASGRPCLAALVGRRRYPMRCHVVDAATATPSAVTKSCISVSLSPSMV